MTPKFSAKRLTLCLLCTLVSALITGCAASTAQEPPPETPAPTVGSYLSALQTLAEAQIEALLAS